MSSKYFYFFDIFQIGLCSECSNLGFDVICYSGLQSILWNIRLHWGFVANRLVCLWSVLINVNKPSVNSLPGWGRYVDILVRRRNIYFFNVMKDSNINRFVVMCKYCNTDLFKKVVDQKKEEGCVCKGGQDHWKTFKISLRDANRKSWKKRERSGGLAASNVGHGKVPQGGKLENF